MEGRACGIIGIVFYGVGSMHHLRGIWIYSTLLVSYPLSESVYFMIAVPFILAMVVNRTFETVACSMMCNSTLAPFFKLPIVNTPVLGLYLPLESFDVYFSPEGILMVTLTFLASIGP